MKPVAMRKGSSVPGHGHLNFISKKDPPCCYRSGSSSGPLTSSHGTGRLIAILKHPWHARGSRRKFSKVQHRSKSSEAEVSTLRYSECIGAAVAGDVLESLQLLSTDPVDAVHWAGLHLGVDKVRNAVGPGLPGHSIVQELFSITPLRKNLRTFLGPGSSSTHKMPPCTS